MLRQADQEAVEAMDTGRFTEFGPADQAAIQTFLHDRQVRAFIAEKAINQARLQLQYRGDASAETEAEIATFREAFGTPEPRAGGFKFPKIKRPSFKKPSFKKPSFRKPSFKNPFKKRGG